MLLPVVVSSSNELISTNPTIHCCLTFVSFDCFVLQSHQVWGLGELNKTNATSLHASLHTPIHTAANGRSCTFAIQK